MLCESNWKLFSKWWPCSLLPFSCCVTKKSVKLIKLQCKINNYVALRRRHSLFGWVHRGIAPPKMHACWVQESFCLYNVFYTHIHWLSQTKHTYNNHFPKISNIFPILYHRPQCYSWQSSRQGTGAGELTVFFLTQWAWCSSTGQWFW